MIKRLIAVACLTAMLGFSAPAMATAQLGDLAKQAGKATVDTTKQAGKKVEEGAKKATTATKEAITGVPRGATGRCKDGTYTMTKTRSRACSGHYGVDRWY
jgi:ABC-type transporter MlaC component